MNTSIKATHIKLTEEIQSYVEKKMGSVEEKFTESEDTVACTIELAKTRDQKHGPVYYAEANMQVNGTLFRATAEEESTEAAIDKVKDELQRELRDARTKHKDRMKKGGAKAKRMLQAAVF